MTHITKNLEDLKQRIATACKSCGRSENDVSILAVSKRHSVESIRSATQAGLHSMGENYLQEALQKIPCFGTEIEWHFIGAIQSNKTKMLAENFQWVQTIASAHIAERISRQRPGHLDPLNVCIQVDTDQTGLHGGIQAEHTESLCELINGLPNLRLRGLMTIPLPAAEMELQRVPFRRLRKLYDYLLSQGFQLDTLSMGMTADLEAAVTEGSTMLRVGTALFGPRPV